MSPTYLCSTCDKNCVRIQIIPPFLAVTCRSLMKDSPGFSGRTNLSGGRRGSAATPAAAANQQSERIELTYRRLVVRTPFTRQTRITVVAETTSRLAAAAPTPDGKSPVHQI